MFFFFYIHVLCKNNREKKKKICSNELQFAVVSWSFVFITISKSDTFGATQDLLPLDQAQNVDWS